MKKETGRKCQSEFPFIPAGYDGAAVRWFPCQRRGAHKRCRYEGIIYDNGPHEAQIKVTWKTE